MLKVFLPGNRVSTIKLIERGALDARDGDCERWHHGHHGHHGCQGHGWGHGEWQFHHVMARQQNFTEKQYLKQLIDNWPTVFMVHRSRSLAVPTILVRKVKRSQEQHLCTYFDFNQTSPIGLDSSVTANCAQVSWSTTRTAWTLLQGQSFELNLYSNLLCLCSGW